MQGKQDAIDGHQRRGKAAGIVLAEVFGIVGHRALAAEKNADKCTSPFLSSKPTFLLLFFNCLIHISA
jgi:hypothetical protein